jgi:hypothetical protein
VDVAGASTEREGIGLHAGVEKFDFERAIRDRAGLPDKLVQALLANNPSGPSSVP